MAFRSLRSLRPLRSVFDLTPPASARTACSLWLFLDHFVHFVHSFLVYLGCDRAAAFGLALRASVGSCAASLPAASKVGKSRFARFGPSVGSFAASLRLPPTSLRSVFGCLHSLRSFRPLRSLRSLRCESQQRLRRDLHSWRYVGAVFLLHTNFLLVKQILPNLI